MRKFEPPVVRHETAPPTAAPSPDARESAPARPRTRRWAWLAAAIAVTALVVAGVVWLMVSTVPQSTYDEATDSLATAEADVARLERQIDALEDEVHAGAPGRWRPHPCRRVDDAALPRSARAGLIVEAAERIDVEIPMATIATIGVVAVPIGRGGEAINHCGGGGAVQE